MLKPDAPASPVLHKKTYATPAPAERNCLFFVPILGHLAPVPGGGKCRSSLLSRAVGWTKPERL